MSQLHIFLVLVAFGWLTGCVQSDEPSEFRLQGYKAVYGEDSRIEAMRCQWGQPCETIRRATAALVHSDAILVDPDQGIVIRAPSAQERFQLCDSERFYDQISAAHCTGVLIDDNLMLTAAHCIASEAECKKHFWIFDYQLTFEGEFPRVLEESIFSCRRLLWVHRDTSTDLGGLDLAIIQLDRSATPFYQPIAQTLSSDLPSEGEPLWNMGFSLGTPMKASEGVALGLSDGASIVEQYAVALDVFVGQSGSGIFNVFGELVGIVSSGAPDLRYQATRNCRVVNRYDESGIIYEVISDNRHAVEALCETGWGSERLCGQAGTCGDGFCDVLESESTCGEDCAIAFCGDRVCNLGELGQCVSDCGAHAPVPDSWRCPRIVYGVGDGCDCECGAYDPDCYTENATVFGCFAGQFCNNEAHCEFYKNPPNDWRCRPDEYGTEDGCHCTCGAYDPDCVNNVYPAIYCPISDMCDKDGFCVLWVPPDDPAPPEVSSAPIGWSCDAEYFNDGAACDCLCGVYDVDCSDETLPTYNCPDNYHCNKDAECRPLMAMDGWICDVNAYATSDGCDCNCGVYDPDCGDPSQNIWGCESGFFCNKQGICEKSISRSAPPVDWQCPAQYYAAKDGCDCACGSLDPDCNDPQATRWGCLENEVCSAQGWCVHAITSIDHAENFDKSMKKNYTCQSARFNYGMRTHQHVMLCILSVLCFSVRRLRRLKGK